jgi:hypothetical protein
MLHTRHTLGLALLTAALGCSSENGPTTATPGGQSGAAGLSGSGGSQAQAGTAGTAGAASGAASGGAGSGGASACGTCPMGAACKAGACQCPAFAPDVCDQKCVDMKVDAEHCGVCTTKCDPGATCNASACGEKPAAVVPQAAGCEALHLALGADVLYWTDKMHGTVMSMPTAGGAAKTIAMTQAGPSAIAVDATNLYWLNSTDKTVMKSALPSGAATQLATPLADAAGAAVRALALFGDTLYYSAGDHIYKVPTAGGDSLLVGTTQQMGIPGALVADANQLVYPTEVHNDVEIMQVGATAGMTTRVAESQGSLYFDTIILSGESVYWANGGRVLSGMPSGTNNSMTVVNSAEIGNVTGFAIGATNVYFGEDGFVEKGPLPSVAVAAGGDGVKLARGQLAPTSFVLDAAKVYWASDCAILSAAQ